MLALKIQYKVRLKGIDRETLMCHTFNFVSEYIGLTIHGNQECMGKDGLAMFYKFIFWRMILVGRPGTIFEVWR